MDITHTFTYTEGVPDEDNIFHQFAQNGQKSICISDNTWELFAEACNPKSWTQFDFNALQINSDNNIIPYIFPYLYMGNDPHYYENFNKTLPEDFDKCEHLGGREVNTILFPDIVYNDMIYNYSDLPKIDFTPDFEKADDNWDFMLLHWDGVDHAGHSFGKMYPVMAFKL